MDETINPCLRESAVPTRATVLRVGELPIHLKLRIYLSIYLKSVCSGVYLEDRRIHGGKKSKVECCRN